VNVNIYLSGSNPVHDKVLRAFYAGVPVNHGLTAELRDVNRPLPSDIAVVFGIRKEKVPISYPRGEIIKRQMAAKRPVVVLETGYVKRGDGDDHYYAAGLNGLNGRADFRNRNMPGDRWAKLGVALQPWRTQGEHIVVCGQVPWDASVQHHDHMGWIRQTISRLSGYTGRRVIFRPHPLARNLNYGPLIGADEISAKPLGEDLQGAHAVVTFNSNTGVDAVIAGVPIFTIDRGSMAWEVSDHDLSEIEKPNLYDREQWAHNLAYTQWTMAEMAGGWAWSHLFRP
jgi:hypothetical protein